MYVPRATYRLQLTPELGFDVARRLVPYLARLGIQALYASPILAARSGSSHGYDVVDPQRLNPALGTRADFDALVAELRAHDMALILDIVPNHMAASPQNAWWTDVLKHGLDSPHARAFDIDWYRSPTSSVERAQVLLPILGTYFGDVLENQELQLVFTGDALVLRYYDNDLPLAPGTYGPILRATRDRLIGSSDAPETTLRGLLDLSVLSDLIGARPDGTGSSERRREAVLRFERGLLDVLAASPAVRSALEEAARELNGVKGDPRSFDALEDLVGRQAYRLAHWRAAAERVNYRRFFDVSDLVSLRIEDPAVRDATHRLVLDLVAAGGTAGLRVDHVDGLKDPLGYLQWLRERVDAATPGPAGGGGYIVVEKILERDEALPPEWPIAGTTGYDFLNAVNGLFVDPAGLQELGNVYARFTGIRDDFVQIAYQSKRRVIDDLFAGEIRSLGRQLEEISERDRYARNLSPDSLRQALTEVILWLPVYRTYTRDRTVRPPDRERIVAAITSAVGRSPALEARALDFLRRVLTLEFPPTIDDHGRDAWLQFVMRWQQLTGPVTGKGVEDTSFYVYNRLIALNEVGGDPAGSSDPVAAFHRLASDRRDRQPHTMNATSTHDTKRGEDVRVRIDVLSEIPHAWELALSRWSKWNSGCKQRVGDALVPDANEEAFIYQTLLGAWPILPGKIEPFRERLRVYLVKALREAKVHTSWLAPEPDYEAAVLAFVDAVLTPGDDSRFLPDFLRFEQRIAATAVTYSLAQLLIKITAPGVPDFYQGTELWDLNLADPDNRRPIDFATRQALLADLGTVSGVPAIRELLTSWRDGRVKLHVTSQGLAWRARRSELFAGGDYVPLDVVGEHAERVVAFARVHGSQWVIVVVPRLSAGLSPSGRPPLGRRAWGSTALILPERAPRTWRNGLTGERLRPGDPAGRELPLARVFQTLPVALLLPVERRRSGDGH